MSFLTELRFEDLQRLRKLVRGVWMKHYRAHHITTAEIDKLIEQAGEKACLTLLKRGVDKGVV